MKNWIFTIALLTIFAGCRTTREITTDTTEQQTIFTDTVYKTVKVQTYLPGEIIEITRDSIIFIEVMGEKPLVNIPPVTAKTSMAMARASVNNNKINLLLWQKDSLITHKIDSLREIITNTKATTKIVNRNIETVKTKNSAFARLCIYWFFSSIIMVLIWLYFKINKPKFF